MQVSTVMTQSMFKEFTEAQVVIGGCNADASFTTSFDKHAGSMIAVAKAQSLNSPLALRFLHSCIDAVNPS
jgi:hypothetical protein